jgi:MFS family permease
MRVLLRRPDVRLLLGGLVASMVGESILVLALAIWVKSLTGSSGLAGTTIVAVVAPMALAPLIGWFVDRFRRRPFLVSANLAVAVALTPLFAVHGRDDVWIIYLVAVLYGLSYINVNAALNGLIKEVVPPGELAAANGVLQTVKQGLRLAGPVTGAALYTRFGGWPLALVGATGFGIAAIAIGAMRVKEARPTLTAQRWSDEVSAGLRYVICQPVLCRTTIGVAGAMFLLGFNETLVFSYVDLGLHQRPGFVGVLAAVQGVGGLFGGVSAAALVRRLGEVGTVGLGMMAFLPAASFSLVVPSLWLAFPGMIVFGFGVPCTLVGFNTLLQRVTPGELVGRVAAATDALISGPGVVSIAGGALFVMLVDYRLLFAVTGVALLAVGCFVWFGRTKGAVANFCPQG